MCGVEAALRGADAIRTAKWSEVPASINIERSVIFNVAEDAKSVTGTMFWLMALDCGETDPFSFSSDRL